MSKARGLADLGNAFNDGALSNRNILINGNLKVNQRGLSIASVGTGSYGEDRWKKTAGGMTQIIEEANYLPSTEYTLSGTGVTTQQITSPSSGNWTLPDLAVTARLIQLELGDTATPFEHRSYGQELALCQRYYQELNLPSNHYFLCTRLSVSSGTPYGIYTLPVEMRSTPTLSQSGTWFATSGYAGIPVLASPSGKFIRIGGATSVAANATVYVTGGDINIDAEL